MAENVRDKLLIVILLILSVFRFYGQDLRYTFNGYIHKIDGVFGDSLEKEFINYNLVHSRVNFDLYWKDVLQFEFDSRARLFYGNMLTKIPNAKQLLGYNLAYFNLNFNPIEEKNLLLNYQIDRLWVKLSFKRLEFTVGRQRINWAKTFFWNPNDIFNTYSLFEIDYPERPGTDGVDLTCYFGTSEMLEIAGSLGKENLLFQPVDTVFTGAAKFAFSLGTYDIQMLGGIYKSDNYVFGFGWTGYIGQAAFRGEFSYIDRDSVKDYFFSTGLDWSMPNGFLFAVEGFYNSYGDKVLKELLATGSGFALYQAPSDIRYLSFSKFSLGLQTTYQLSPLVNLSLIGITTVPFRGYFIVPTVSFSLSENVDFSIFSQIVRLKTEMNFNNNLIKIDQKFYGLLFQLSYNFGF